MYFYHCIVLKLNQHYQSIPYNVRYINVLNEMTWLVFFEVKLMKLYLQYYSFSVYLFIEHGPFSRSNKCQTEIWYWMFYFHRYINYIYRSKICKVLDYHTTIIEIIRCYWFENNISGYYLNSLNKKPKMFSSLQNLIEEI